MEGNHLLGTEWTQDGTLWGRGRGHQTRGKASERPQAPCPFWEVKVSPKTFRAGTACHLKWDSLAGVMAASLGSARLLIQGFLISSHPLPRLTLLSPKTEPRAPPLLSTHSVRIHGQFLSLAIVLIFLMGFQVRKIHFVTVTGIFVNRL